METRGIVIIGAGPCGLACARELERLGWRDWVILEREAHAGGLAASVTDRAGFTWDLGGHVVFSHFGEFDALLADTMADEILSHDRSSYVRFDGGWVPYPFQNNLRYLPDEVVSECLEGLAAAPGGSSDMNFGTWMRAVFGPGITRVFMDPYNRKVWATPPEWMASHWIAERVSVVDYERALRNVRNGNDDVAWGPNNQFVFPAFGGTGEIYSRLAERLSGQIRYEQPVTEIDAAKRTLRVVSGELMRYDSLVSTMPLDLLVGSIGDAPAEVRCASAKLRHNGVYMVGVGYETPLTDRKSWMYFPQDHAPFYRATNFAKYSPENVPGGDIARYCAYMTETSYSPEKHESRRDSRSASRRACAPAEWSQGAPKSSRSTSRTSRTRIRCRRSSGMQAWR